MLSILQGSPQVVGAPERLKDSFTVTGTPCNGPRNLPTEVSLSICQASSFAASRSCQITALILGLYLSICLKCASRRSLALIVLLRTAKACFLADSKTIEGMFTSPII